MGMKKTTVVLYPGVGVGHLSPMLELAKGILRHGGGAVAVAVVLVDSPFGDPGFDAAVDRARATHTSVSFHVLPAPPPPPSATNADGTGDEHPFVGLLTYLRSTNAPLRDLLRSLMSSSSAPAAAHHALVLDMFCAHALDVAAELAIPAYFFFTSGASALAVLLSLPGARAQLAALRDGGAVEFPGVPPLTATELPTALDDGDALGRATLRLAARMPDGSRGFLVNSFESLEPRAVRALRDGLCLPPGQPMPHVYCVGPLVSPGAGGGAAAAGDRHECLKWMDAQPDRSVVFLCFGSLGTFPKRQLAEIAAGLESSGHRFLWVVRRPPGEQSTAGAGEQSGAGDDILPAGFVERTKGRGLVVTSWAPQVDVLRHRAAGAFVTHCGWNSTLEGIMAGIPMLCWPLYAEQALNKVFVVEEMRLGVGIAMDGEGFVKAAEVEGKVRWVMEGDDGGGARELRERAAAAREKAAEALADGGPSQLAFVEFIKDLETTTSSNV